MRSACTTYYLTFLSKLSCFSGSFGTVVFTPFYTLKAYPFPSNFVRYRKKGTLYCFSKVHNTCKYSQNMNEFIHLETPLSKLEICFTHQTKTNGLIMLQI